MVCDISDFRNQLRRASFKGVTFHVDSASEDYGRRIVVHEFPARDTPYLEDLGQKARRIRIDGYLIGDGCLAQRDALVAACSSFGLGTLIHPFYSRFIIAGCLSLNVTESKEQLGYVKFSMELVEQFSFGFPVSIGYLIQLVIAAGDSLLATTIGLLATTYSVRSTVDYVRLSASDTIREFAIAFDEARLLTRISDGADLAEAIADIYNRADALALDTESLSEALYLMVNRWRLAVTDYTDAARPLERLLYLNASEVPSTSASPSRVKQQANKIALSKVMRAAAGALWCDFLSRSTFDTQPRADVAKNKMALWIESEFNQIDSDKEQEAYTALDALRSQTSRAMLSRYSDIAPPITVSLGQPMSALWIATRVYGDPARAEEVFARSGATNPAFVGPVLELGVR